ncbi:hypothetical protein ACWCV9_13525 [Streptomyces sp. NPDC001606]
MAAGLSHRGVTVVHDFGELEGMPYLVMGHPDTLAARGAEAYCLEPLGRGAKAVAVCRRMAVPRRPPAHGAL